MNTRHVIQYGVQKLASAVGLVAYEPNFHSYKKQLEETSEYTVSDRAIRDHRESLFIDKKDVTLTAEGFEDVIAGGDFSGKRVLEVGPKYGVHATWIDANLKPSELVFCDFASDSALHSPWEPGIRCPHRWVYDDLRNATELLAMETFDLVLFMGVLYHSIFHIELLSMLNRVTRMGGKMVLQTTCDPRPDSHVQMRWVGTRRAKAIPTIDALRLMLTWTGWRKVCRFRDYRPHSNECVFMCEKTDDVRPDDVLSAVVPHHKE